jgi:hypothetical protein
LEHFQFTSFFRVTGYQSLLSASDTSYAVTALLEYEPPTSSSLEDDDDDDDNDDAATESVSPKSSTMMMSSSSIEAFNIAYDALGTTHVMVPTNHSGTSMMNSTEGYDTSTLVNGGNLSATIGLGAGIRYAMIVQKTIIQTAVGLVDRNAIALLRHFRYAYVTSGTNTTTNSLGGISSSSSSSRGKGGMQDRSSSGRNGNNNNNDRDGGGGSTSNGKSRDHIFSKPLALTRLAHYLMDMNRENGKWSGSKARPLVLIAERPRSGTCLVVGYEYPERSGDFVRNKFGKHFEMTAMSMNGIFQFDNFDSNVVEVNGPDVNRFLEQLHYLLDSTM